METAVRDSDLAGFYSGQHILHYYDTIVGLIKAKIQSGEIHLKAMIPHEYKNITHGVRVEGIYDLEYNLDTTHRIFFETRVMFFNQPDCKRIIIEETSDFKNVFNFPLERAIVQDNLVECFDAWLKISVTQPRNERKDKFEEYLKNLADAKRTVKRNEIRKDQMHVFQTMLNRESNKTKRYPDEFFEEIHKRMRITSMLQSFHNRLQTLESRVIS